MNGIEYLILVFGTVLLIVVVAAGHWKKRNNQN